MTLVSLLLLQAVASATNPLNDALVHFNQPQLGCTAQVAISHREIAVDCQSKDQFRSLRKKQPSAGDYEAFGAGSSENGAHRFYVKPKRA